MFSFLKVIGRQRWLLILRAAAINFRRQNETPEIPLRSFSYVSRANQGQLTARWKSTKYDAHAHVQTPQQKKDRKSWIDSTSHLPSTSWNKLSTVCIRMQVVNQSLMLQMIRRVFCCAHIPFFIYKFFSFTSIWSTHNKHFTIQTTT